MEDVRIRFEPPSIGRLQPSHFIRLDLSIINRETLIDKEVPDFFPAPACIERFVLSVAQSANLLVCARRFRAITLSNVLNDAFALIYLPPQHRPQVATFGP